MVECQELHSVSTNPGSFPLWSMKSVRWWLVREPKWKKIFFCFLNGDNSSFPNDTDMVQSVCKWQKGITCRLSGCMEGETYEENQASTNHWCVHIRKHCLSNIPAGIRFSSPELDTNADNAPSKILYSNQHVHPLVFPPCKQPSRRRSLKQYPGRWFDCIFDAKSFWYYSFRSK
jgi:hypothetical protein